MKVSIIYDNTAINNKLKADWGFACLIEVTGQKILFDTGAKGNILLRNMEILNIKPKSIGAVFISHAHWDHTGGLDDFLKKNRNACIYIPSSYHTLGEADNITSVGKPITITENIYSTGELKNIEQSLVIKTESGLVVIVGCSHSGVGSILEAASQYGEPAVLIGGFHGFSEFDLLEDLRMICPTHCTRYIEKIKTLYPDKYKSGGAGTILEIQ